MILREAFAGDERVWRFVDLAQQRIYFKEILGEGTFSAGERSLLAVAASLFSDEISINLWETFNKLDARNTCLVLTAMDNFCRGYRGC